MDKTTGAGTALLADENFAVLLHLFSRRAVTWRQFLKLPQPQGVSPLETWNILGRLGRLAGVTTSLPAEPGLHYWYLPTFELVELVSSLSFHCSSASPLNSALRGRDNARSLLELRLAEVEATLQMEGLDLSYERLFKIVTGQGVPTNAREQLALNFYRLDENLESYVKEPFTRRLYNRLRERLLVGVSLSELESCANAPCYQAATAQEEIAQQHLVTILAYANDELDGANEDYPVLKGSLIADSIRCSKPDGALTSPLASCLARLYYLKKGLGVLGVMPLTQGKLLWFNDGITEPDVACSAPDYLESVRYGPGSLTVHQMINAQLMTLLLADLRGYCSSRKKRNDALYHLLEENFRLNHRQRSVLARAARMPFAEFHIQYHQEKHHIAYSTARRDLLELSEMGYLRRKRQSRAFVFVPEKRVAELAEDPLSDGASAHGIDHSESLATASLSRQIHSRSQAMRPVRCALHFDTTGNSDASMNSITALKPVQTAFRHTATPPNYSF
jgi:hypothetical protein